MLYKVDFSGQNLRMANIANIVAYAQMYMCLPLVAPQLQVYLLQRNDIWSDVRRQPLFHLGIANKIRCPEIFKDALRHLIGRGVHYSVFEKAGLDLGESAMMVSDLRDQLDSKVHELKVKIARLTLTDYVKHSNSSHPGAPVGTTLLSASWDIGLTTEEKAAWLAKCAFRDCFQQRLSGEPHWSHIRHFQYHCGNYGDGFFHPVSLRELCNKIRDAHLKDEHMGLFEGDVVERLVAEFGLESSEGLNPSNIISETLKDIVKSVYKLASPLLDGTQYLGPSLSLLYASTENAGHCATRTHKAYSPCSGSNAVDGIPRTVRHSLESGQCAEDGEGCCYFTHLKIGDHVLPWNDESEWEEFHIDGLKTASVDWLKALDAVGNETVEIEPFEDSEGTSRSEEDESSEW